MEITEATAKPEAEQSEEGRMRDTDEGRSAAATSQTTVGAAFEPPPGWEQWSTATRRNFKRRQREKQRRGEGGDQGTPE